MALARVSGAVACSVAALSVLVACSDRSEILRPPVTIGVTTDSPGVNWQDPVTNKRSGIDVAMYEWIASHADEGFDPQVVEVTVAEREEELIRGGDAGGVDLVVATYSISSPRDLYVDFAGPYLETRQGVMVRKDDPRRIINPSQLSGRSVCAEKESTSVRELRRLPDVVVIEEDRLAQCVDKLKAGEADAVSTDELVLIGYARSDSALRVENGATFGAIQQWGIGLPPEDGTASCELVTSYIERYLAEGDWDKAFNEAFGDGIESEDFKPKNMRPCVADPDEG